jgi:hypothetical protein
MKDVHDSGVMWVDAIGLGVQRSSIEQERHNI